MITLNVNGQIHQVDVPSDTPLLWVLRDILFLTGTKYGCGISVCWACAIIVNGQAEKSCDYTAGAAQGKTITTIEGLSTMSPDPNNPINRLQQSWIEHQAPQCGYCQSGMLMKAAALYLERQGEDNPIPSDGDINGAMKNICVCGTYQRVKAAIKGAAHP
jgi:isoquinoline 1-oxidoreductase alpha subunit